MPVDKSFLSKEDKIQKESVEGRLQANKTVTERRGPRMDVGDPDEGRGPTLSPLAAFAASAFSCSLAMVRQSHPDYTDTESSGGVLWGQGTVRAVQGCSSSVFSFSPGKTQSEYGNQG